jgi:hypothetical protein
MTRDPDERFRRDYAPAFLQYLSEGGEPGRRAAYELGRRAISERLSILDVARTHHTVLLEALKSHRTPNELEQIARAASEFLVEALAVFEMTNRGFTELLSTGQSGQADSADERIRRMAAREGVTVDEAAARLGRPPSGGRRPSGRGP